MLLSQNKVNDLLQIFDNPKSIEPYNISYQKEEVKNAFPEGDGGRRQYPKNSFHALEKNRSRVAA